MSGWKVRDPLPSTMPEITVFYAGMLAGSWVTFAVLHHFWGQDMLVSFHDLWRGGSVSLNGLASVCLIFIWAFVVTLVGVLVNPGVSFTSRPVLLIRGIWLSLHAGVFEEITFRALTFMSAMVLLRFFNWITFGLTKWFFTTVLVRLANFTTFHALQPQLLHPGSWVFGAAIVSAAAAFRKEHQYLGLLGWINSWYIGMVMFYLMFNYGLATAIMAHFLYDAIIFVLIAATVRHPRDMNAIVRMAFMAQNKRR